MKSGFASLQAAIRNPETQIVSFDVFDTLIVRPFWEPSDLFLLLNREAARLLKTSCAVDFSSCRKEAETAVRAEAREKGREDITIKEIYNHIAKAGVFPGESVHLLMEKELELELRFCKARESTKSLLLQALAEGKRVVAISDMYLPSSFIEKMLNKTDIPIPEKIYVSCEACLTKRSGRLFEFAMKELQVPSRAVVHIGDNMKSDVEAARKLGIRAFLYARPAALLKGKAFSRSERPFRRAFGGISSPLTGKDALQNLGVRCMLAVAANRLFDNPYRTIPSGTGDYGKDPERLGTVALGMYCMAHAVWIDRIAQKEKPDRVLFFSRDGYLVRRGFELLQEYRQDKTESVYVHTSRKARFPMLLTDRKLLLSAGVYVGYQNQCPRSLAELTASVLDKDKLEALRQESDKEWETVFPNTSAMLLFLEKLRTSCVDAARLRDYQDGYLEYFTPLMGSSVLTYDVGYNIRTESILKHFFPGTKITACCTHTEPGDLAFFSGDAAQIDIRQLYRSVPFVSFAMREIMISEDAPSCAYYSRDCGPVPENGHPVQELIRTVHRYALAFMEDFASIFGNDVRWLPMDFIAACLPFESFLHSPFRPEKKMARDIWFEDLYNQNSTPFIIQKYWRCSRLDYLLAKHHAGQYSRYVIKTFFLLATDREALKRKLSKHFSTLRRKS